MPAVKPGDKVGEYRLEECIGRGAFGEVWRASHAVFGEPAAVKIPTDPEYIKNLRTEAIIQHQVRNAHIVRTLGLDPWHDPPYMVMEYVDGTSLRDLIRDGGGLPVETVTNYARQILDGMAAAHAAGVIHRDLKPENILVEPDGTVKVTDFGLGRVEEATSRSILQSGSLVSASGASVVGTVEYMAPEQKTGQVVDQRADIYAFGVILFEMLTGSRPTGVDVPSDLKSGSPPYLDDIFRRCHCHFDRRFAAVDEVLAALDEVLTVEVIDDDEVIELEPMPQVPRSVPAAAPAGLPARHIHRDVIIQALREFLPQDDFSVAPDIPPKKIANARSKAEIPPGEEVQALVDMTVFGSAKNCVAFCTTGVYYHGGWEGKTPGAGSIPYADFPNRAFSAHSNSEAYLDNGRFVSTSGSSVSAHLLTAMLNAVRDAIVRSGGRGGGGGS